MKLFGWFVNFRSSSCHFSGIQKKRGSFVPLFVVFVLIAFGVAGTSLYIGRRVENSIGLQVSADAAAQAAAHHQAKFMNQIAFNNQAIGASFHVNANLLLLTYYLGIARALSYDLMTEFEHIFDEAIGRDNPIQEVFTNSHRIGRHFVQMSIGASQYSQDLLDLKSLAYGAPIRAIEIGTLNRPSSLVVTLQGNSKNPAAMTNPRGLKVTETRETACHSAKSFDNEELKERVTAFLIGPLLSVGSSFAGSFEAASSIGKFFETDILKKLPVKLSVVSCGIGLTGPLVELLDPASWVSGAENIFSKGVKNSILFMRLRSNLESDFRSASDGKFCNSGANESFLMYSFGIGSNDKDRRLSLTLKSLGESEHCESVISKNEKTGKLQEVKECRPNTILFSELNMKECEGETQETKPACFRKLEIKKTTYICPLVRNTIAGGGSISVLKAVTVCKSGRGWRRFKSPVRHTGSEGQSKIIEHCKDFNDLFAEGRNPESGLQLIDWGTQMEKFNSKLTKDKQVRFGFITVDNQKLLRESLQYKSIIVEPEWTAKEVINEKEAFCNNRNVSLSGEDGSSTEEYCAVAPAIGLKAENNDGGIESDAQNLLMEGGVAALYRLRNEKKLLERSSLSMSSFEVAFVPKDPKIELPTFWPAWVALPQKVGLTEVFSGKSESQVKFLDVLSGNMSPME